MAKAKSIRVKKEGQGKTNVCRSHLKRILMLRRRISILIDEKESLEEKNRDLINSYNSEKKLNAELQKDVFNWQRLYHEAKISQNTYKVKQAEIEQVVSSCLKELKSTFPHLVGLSDTICRNQIRLTNLQNACHTFERENNLPLSRDGRQTCSDLSNKSEKRMRHKVGPMVNGVLIQKPTIRLERVMLQQPPDQATNNERTPERGNNLTPIAEENEQEADLHLEQVSMRRRRKHRLGTGERWRLRKQQEQLEKERQKERERERESQIDSSDSEDQLGPVIRLQRVSGLLLSPNLLEVDRGRSSEGKGTSRPSDSESLRLRSNEDPREGCSWMHMSSQKISAEKRKERQSESSPSSDSTDEESDSLNAVAEKVRKSFTDSLFKNQSFVKRKTSSSSSVADTSRDVSDSSKIEPDSTNNIDTVICPGTTIIDDSLAMNHSLQPDATRSPEERDSVGVAINPSSSAVEDSVPERRPSSFCNNCTPAASPNVRGKRIRKPKVHLYPGEEYENQAPTTSTTTAEPKVKKMKKTGTANNKKSVPSRLSDSRKSTGKRPLKNSMEPGSRSSSVERQSLKNSQDPSISSAIKKKTQQRKTKSLLTKSSVGTSRTSENMRLSQDQDESDRRNSRRNKAPVSYKEPPGNVKMRRPK